MTLLNVFYSPQKVFVVADSRTHNHDSNSYPNLIKIISVPSINGLFAACNDMDFVVDINDIFSGALLSGHHSEWLLGAKDAVNDYFETGWKESKIEKFNRLKKTEEETEKLINAVKSTLYLFGFDWAENKYRGYKFEYSDSIFNQRELILPDGGCVLMPGGEPGNQQDIMKNKMNEFFPVLNTCNRKIQQSSIIEMSKFQRKFFNNEQEKGNHSTRYGGYLTIAHLHITSKGYPEIIQHSIPDQDWS